MTEDRIKVMGGNEVMLRAYDLARSDMSIACFESEAETMQHTLSADVETLRLYLLESVECMDDTDFFYYKDVTACIESTDGSVLIMWDDAEKWFDDVASLVEFIDSEVA